MFAFLTKSTSVWQDQQLYTVSMHHTPVDSIENPD